MEKNIPEQVKLAAMRLGNSILFVGELDGWEIYSVGTVDKNGMPVPTGLPTLILWDGTKIKKVNGFNALDLLGRFD